MSKYLCSCGKAIDYTKIIINNGFGSQGGPFHAIRYKCTCGKITESNGSYQIKHLKHLYDKAMENCFKKTTEEGLLRIKVRSCNEHNASN